MLRRGSRVADGFYHFSSEDLPKSRSSKQLRRLQPGIDLEKNAGRLLKNKLLALRLDGDENWPIGLEQ